MTSEWAHESPEVLHKIHLYETEEEMNSDIAEAAEHDWFGKPIGENKMTGQWEAEFTHGAPMAKPNEPGQPAHELP